MMRRFENLAWIGLAVGFWLIPIPSPYFPYGEYIAKAWFAMYILTIYALLASMLIISVVLVFIMPFVGIPAVVVAGYMITNRGLILP